jgi:hypothetical protein
MNTHSLYFSMLWKIKAGKLDVFRDWMNQLKDVRREEALATFGHESITREVFVLFSDSEGNHYVLGFNEASISPKSPDLSIPINVEHKKIKEECLEPITDPGEVLLDLSK